MSSHVEPRLTTIRVFKEEMGKLAVQRLVDIIKSKTETVTTVHVPVEFIMRDSSSMAQAPDMPDDDETPKNVSPTIEFL